VQHWRLIRQFDQRLQGLTQRYGRLLQWVLGRKLAVIAATLLVLGSGSVAMAMNLPQEILPQIDTGQAELWVQFPPAPP
jgi:multidrug efflux pump subunit AcrB